MAGVKSLLAFWVGGAGTISGGVDCNHVRIRIRCIGLIGMRGLPGLPLHSPIGFGWFEYG
jgi:hypothetical protein